MEASKSFRIQFTMSIGKAEIKVQVSASVLLSDCETFYFVYAYMHADLKIPMKFPEIRIKKTGDEWVHIDTGIANNLSINAGNAIEHENGYKPAKKKFWITPT